ncbi:hypothetical protein EVAR_74270_1 [Eumeta japonica]|uniref:Uncharacterized protein n=1 Tax=Eumeta variegata TaxID=151549 RepID=A0A4C1SFE6_EUMVA|nr:hypothetical protein EVAR_74270_1 [Eumeta japonica]
MLFLPNRSATHRRILRGCECPWAAVNNYSIWWLAYWFTCEIAVKEESGFNLESQSRMGPGSKWKTRPSYGEEREREKERDWCVCVSDLKITPLLSITYPQSGLRKSLQGPPC